MSTYAQQQYYPQLSRIRGKTVDLHRFLSDGKWHINMDCFLAGGLSFQGRLHQLRKLGYTIDSRYVRPGLWEYRLTGWAPPTAQPKRLSRPQQKLLHELEQEIRNEFGEDGLRRLRTRLPERYRDPDEHERRPQGPGADTDPPTDNPRFAAEHMPGSSRMRHSNIDRADSPATRAS